MKKTPKLSQDNTPKPDTTNGKETVGIKAENIEPNGTNIVGHNHSMNGTTQPEGSGFRDASTELQDVTIGLVKRTNGRDNITDTTIRVVKGGIGYVKSSLRVKAISTSDPITDFEITGNNGFSLTPKKEGLNSKEATVSFEGTTPNTGSWKITVTAVTKKGRKSFEFEYYTILQKPTIETTNNQLSGQADNKPSVTIKSPDKPGSFNGRAKLRVYLIRGGADLTAYGMGDQGAYPENYTILAAKDVAADGTTTITENDYIVPKIGAGTVKAITVLELSGNVNDRNVGERGSYMSDERTVTAAPTVDKSGAINAITIEAEKQNGVIDSKQNVFTSNEVTAFKAMVTNAAQTAKDNINKTDTDTDTKVNAERDKGILALNKIGAIVEVEAAKKAKDAAIENNANITDKAAAKAATKAAADAAKAEINKTETNTADKVTEEKTKGLLGIEKAGAIAEIDAAKAAKDAAIENNANITDKAAAKAATKAAADAAKAEINKTETNTADKVTEEKTKGLLGIEKAGAIAEIDAAKAAKDAAIENNANITDKAAAKAATKAAADAAKAEINKTETNTADKVTEEKTKGLLGIEKAGAIAEIDAAKAEKDTAINKNNGLTTEEKSEVKKQTQKEAADAIVNINKATTSADVTTAKEAGIKAINAVEIPTKTVKSNAIAEVKRALEAKIRSVDSNEEFTTNEKKILKEKAEKVAMLAILEIKAATTNEIVETAKNTGIETINSVEARLAAKVEVPELIVTKWEDEVGNELKPADAKAPLVLGEANEAFEHGEVTGYKFVTTKVDDKRGVVTHIFRKLPEKGMLFPVMENSSKKASLPNTGEDATNTGLAGLGLSMLGGLLIAARQRRNKR